MNKTTYLITLTALAAFAGSSITFAQQGPDEAAVAKAATQGQKILKPEDLKWNKDLQWVNFIVDEGGVQSARGYFGAISKKDYDALLNGTAKGFLTVQQCFYFNNATRLFSRFDAPAPGASISLYQHNAFFRTDSVMRVVPLNRQFVENLAVRKFLDVAGK
jgi:hypothetical protein